METNYIIIMDYSNGNLIKIKLSSEQKREANTFDDLENYVLSLETRYGFRLKDCEWMVVEKINEISYI